MAETLTRRQYQVFVLSFLEGMTLSDIAAEFNLSISTVSRAYLSARERMRTALGYSLEAPLPHDAVGEYARDGRDE